MDLARTVLAISKQNGQPSALNPYDSHMCLNPKPMPCVGLTPKDGQGDGGCNCGV